MNKTVHVAIIGAGSAGLSALRQVAKQTDSYVLIDQTPLGTKCARTGCMPSKALIHAAKVHHQCHQLVSAGIQKTRSERVCLPAVLKHVRGLRDHFADSMAEATRQRAKDHLIAGRAKILSAHRIRVNDSEIHAEKIIIATGSRPSVPALWKKFGDRILTSDTIFEQQDLPERIAVVGLGPIGLEIGQSLSRLGLDVTCFNSKPSIAATTDPAINAASIDIFRNEFPIFLEAEVEIEASKKGLQMQHGSRKIDVDAAFVAIGVTPQLERLGLENLGVKPDANDRFPFDPQTMQLADLPVFIAGDVNSCRPILHEALDEGYIAGQNSGAEKINCYCRRTPLHIIFSDPQIATVGQHFQELQDSQHHFVTGKADFQDQSRAVLEQQNRGLLHVYADRESAVVLGAELVCPSAEHLSHQLAVAIQHQLTVLQMLQLPFYHPTIEEAMRTALLDAASQISEKGGPGPSLCDCSPESPLC